MSSPHHVCLVALVLGLVIPRLALSIFIDAEGRQEAGDLGTRDKGTTTLNEQA